MSYRVVYFLSFAVLIISTMKATQGTETLQHVKYAVMNHAAKTPAGKRFESLVGSKYCMEAMIAATDFICTNLGNISKKERKSKEKITLHIIKKGQARFNDNNGIYIPAGYIDLILDDDMREEFKGVIHEFMPTIWLGLPLNGPVALIEGIGPFVRIQAGFVPKNWKVKKGDGEKWDESQEVTGWFLVYCNEKKSGFVKELYKKIKSKEYSEDIFLHMLRETLALSWTAYKTKYGNAN